MAKSSFKARKFLYLLRHAKSSWEIEGQEDFDRPLNHRGHGDVRRMADYLRDEKVRPDLVLCSPAKRTRQTQAALAAALEGAEVKFPKKFYMIGSKTLLEELKGLGRDLKSVMVIAHNPGLESLAQALLDPALGGHGEGIRAMEKKYPTCTLAAFSLPVADWKDLALHSCRLDAFVRPADLAQAYPDD
jgi:phosphohistidine phosphatase